MYSFESTYVCDNLKIGMHLGALSDTIDKALNRQMQ